MGKLRTLKKVSLRRPGNLKQRHRLHFDTARKNIRQPHPLETFLEQLDDSDSRIWLLARQMSREPFDVNCFHAELLDKLQRTPYVQAGAAIYFCPKNPDKHKYTFYDRLKSARALSVFLRTSTLRRIREWLLLRDIVRTDRELERKHLSVERYPLRFHSFLTSELSRHERAITAAISKYKVEQHWLDEYLSAVDREKMRQLRILCLSRWPRSREDLVGRHNNEDLVAAIGIFELLEQCFAKALPIRFVRRLTQLVCAPPEANEISNDRDDALLQALKRRQ
ncbi:MAG TPA: hypothetical protein VKR82_14200 [Candidatus Acidoferrales bacterium]|nr:hypothetical protein [Candidatus Acidoferrales bacterium]